MTTTKSVVVIPGRDDNLSWKKFSKENFSPLLVCASEVLPEMPSLFLNRIWSQEVGHFPTTDQHPRYIRKHNVLLSQWTYWLLDCGHACIPRMSLLPLPYTILHNLLDQLVLCSCPKPLLTTATRGGASISFSRSPFIPHSVTWLRLKDS